MDARLTGRLLALALVVAAGCIIDQDELAGRACTDDTECPSAYACGVANEDGQRTCELVYPPRPSTSDGGGGDAGPVPTYCDDVRPILAANCVSSCHGEDSSGSRRTDFRLDYYEPEGSGPKGARAMATRIKARAFDLRTMPPEGNPAPTAAERALLARWVIGGAPWCRDPSTSDAGSN